MMKSARLSTVSTLDFAIIRVGRILPYRYRNLNGSRRALPWRANGGACGSILRSEKEIDKHEHCHEKDHLPALLVAREDGEIGPEEMVEIEQARAVLRRMKAEFWSY
jgi:hypothetical protein